ncbi:hypothetical protein HDU93_000072 [Gonapodya sp. JEL0774]|nr:hypothetical protein HDU93_000072 [Gonapodya sp. JEL0774]
MEDLVRETFATQNRDNLANVDAQMDALLADIRPLLDSRLRDFHNLADGRRDRVPLLPNNLPFYESYRSLRHAKLREAVDGADNPPRLVTASQLAAQTMKTWHDTELELGENVGDNLEHGSTVERLAQFFGERAHECIEEARILVERWRKFEQALPAYLTPLRTRLEHLRKEFLDAIERWERLSDIAAKKRKEKDDEERRVSAARVAEERAGILPQDSPQSVSESAGFSPRRQSLIPDEYRQDSLLKPSERRPSGTFANVSTARDYLNGSTISAAPSSVSTNQRRPSFSSTDRDRPGRRLTAVLPDLEILNECDEQELSGQDVPTGRVVLDEDVPTPRSAYFPLALERLPDPGYTSSDLLVFFRLLCAQHAGATFKFQIWRARVNQLTANEMVGMIGDIVGVERGISGVWGGNSGSCSLPATQSVLEDPLYAPLFAGTYPVAARPVVHRFRLPQRFPQPDIFIQLFRGLMEQLCVKAPLDQDGGRATAYEAESRLRCQLRERVAKKPVIEYETIWGIGVGGIGVGSGNESQRSPTQESAKSASNTVNIDRVGALAVAAGMLADETIQSPRPPSYPFSSIMPPEIDHSATYVRRADWLQDILLHPSPDRFRDGRTAELQVEKGVDFELRYEWELVGCEDPDHVLGRFKEAARLWTEKEGGNATAVSVEKRMSLSGSMSRRASVALAKRRASKATVSFAGTALDETLDQMKQSAGQLDNHAMIGEQDLLIIDDEDFGKSARPKSRQGSIAQGSRNSRPGSVGNGDSPGSSGDANLFSLFDLGSLVPDPARPRLNEGRSLDAKKRKLAEMIAKNSELREIVEEIGDDDGAEAIEANIREPTTTLLFAEHELVTFSLLRHIRLGELRDILLRQLNFNRSVERRLAIDLREMKNRATEGPVESWSQRGKVSSLAAAANITNIAQATLRIVTDCITEHRDWLDRFHERAADHNTNENGSTIESSHSVVSSVFAGLPPRSGEHLESKCAIGKQFETSAISKAWTKTKSVSLNSPQVQIDLFEVIPALSLIADVHKTAQLVHTHLLVAYEKIFGNPCDPGVAQTVAWKWMLDSWIQLTGPVTTTLASSVGLALGGLEGTLWLENPLLPDIVVAEVMLQFSVETLHSKQALAIMDGNRLAALKLDLVTDSADFARKVPFVDSELEDESEQMSHEEGGLCRIPNLWDKMPPFFGLAVTELDEKIVSAFNFNSLNGIMEAMVPGSLEKLSMALKIQIVEQFHLHSSVELHNVILVEVYEQLLSCQDLSRASFAQLQEERQEETNKVISDVDYKLFICSLVHRKKILRKLMLGEYAKTMPELRQQYLSKSVVPEELFLSMKMKLLEWYYINMREAVTEQCEKLELSQLMQELRKRVFGTKFGKLVFKPSRVRKIMDYFNKEKEPKLDHVVGEGNVQTQDVAAPPSAAHDKLAKLWYIAHPSEIILVGLAPLERTIKQVEDFNAPILPNSQIYGKSLSLQYQLLDIFHLACVYGQLLRDNNRYQATVKIVRVADHVVNFINTMKKDMMYFGVPADLGRTERYLSLKWTFLHIKLKAVVLAGEFSLIVSSAADSAEQLRRTLNFHYPSVRATRIRSGGLSSLHKALTEVEIKFRLRHILVVRLKYFFHCWYLVADETVDQTISINYSVHLRKSGYSRKGGSGHESSRVGDFMRNYKIAILADAVRIYHRLGGKGNANPANLLRETILASEGDKVRLNVVAQMTFDQCQIQALQSYIFQEHTLKMFRQGRVYFEHLADERSGKLFRKVDFINVSSTLSPGLNFKISEQDFADKSAIIQGLVQDLYRGMEAWNKETKLARLANVKIDESKSFSVSRDYLSQVISKFALQLIKWQQKRSADENEFVGAISSRLVDMIRQNELIIHFMVRQKELLLENFRRDVLLQSRMESNAIAAELHEATMKLEQLKGARRVEERRIRNKVIDEYDELVNELVLHSHILRNRFLEYKTNTKQEVLDIMSETKKEELSHMVLSKSMPKAVKEGAKAQLNVEDEMSELRKENHELKMTLMKLRSMNLIKEQGLRSINDKKIRKLSEQVSSTEEKLFTQYKDADAREYILRKQLTKSQKDLAVAETELDAMRKQVKEQAQMLKLQNVSFTSSSSRHENDTLHNDSKGPERKLQKQIQEHRTLIEQLLFERQEHRTVCPVAVAFTGGIDTHSVRHSGNVAGMVTAQSSPPDGFSPLPLQPSESPETRRAPPSLASFFQDSVVFPLANRPSSRLPSARLASAPVGTPGTARAGANRNALGSAVGAKKKRLGSATAPWLTSVGAMEPLATAGAGTGGKEGGVADELSALAVENEQLRRLLERKGIEVPEYLESTCAIVGEGVDGRDFRNLGAARGQTPRGAKERKRGGEAELLVGVKSGSKSRVPNEVSSASNSGSDFDSDENQTADPEPTFEEIIAALSSDSLDKPKFKAPTSAGEIWSGAAGVIFCGGIGRKENGFLWCWGLKCGCWCDKT